MGKKKCILGMLLAGVLVFAGCGSTLPEMTKEQEDKIVEYAAALIMRHTNDYESRLVDLSLYSNPTEDDVQNESDGETASGSMDEVADTDTVDVVEEVYISLEQALLPEGVELDYLGGRVTDRYPDGDGSVSYFLLEASEGKKIFVMQFLVRNVSGQEADVDIFSRQAQGILTINDTEKVQVMSTLLLDDLNTFMGTLTDGGEVALVLLAETNCQSMEEINTLKLVMATEAGKGMEILK